MSSNLPSEYTYNRIVIIGNGFDLALGMKTSYREFLLDYFKVSIKSARVSQQFSNDLVNISGVNFRENDEFWNRLHNFTEIPELLKYCRNIIQIVPSELLRRIIAQVNTENWVDIETLYYNLLILKVEEIKKQGYFGRDFSSIIMLHRSFQCLSEALQQYLRGIQNYSPFIPFDSPLFGFTDDLEIQLPKNLFNFAHGKDVPISAPKNVLYLNFNYTNFLSSFFRANSNNRRIEIRVHGDLSNYENPIIFGYGDDSHQYYHEIEVLDHPEPLSFIKSFHYPKTNNYHHLLDFISSANFEVSIVGHSCGLSDRTLLKTIFENDNCLSIRIFHRNDPQEHFLKTIAISRHFSDKQIMRKKILPFDQFAQIPQKA